MQSCSNEFLAKFSKPNKSNKLTSRLFSLLFLYLFKNDFKCLLNKSYQLIGGGWLQKQINLVHNPAE